ncbi:hypothetical protein EKG38_05460 [Shewanella canadensis]|uniref:Uncharacterized protein n=1 Tax=Shewanella canadensis TaxID=271096 RepID=A0A3S0RZQ2_9GAMM|nr:hypothetical protein EKG38_05460 [Shewanella canadensis]
MFNTKASTQVLQSKLTLVLLLVVFVSQLFPTCVASDIHTNAFASQESSPAQATPFGEKQEDCCHVQGHICHVSAASEQEEHDDDFHTSCHPPMELHFACDVNRVEGESPFLISYQDRKYAPPIPPPHS